MKEEEISVKIIQIQCNDLLLHCVTDRTMFCKSKEFCKRVFLAAGELTFPNEASRWIIFQFKMLSGFLWLSLGHLQANEWWWSDFVHVTINNLQLWGNRWQLTGLMCLLFVSSAKPWSSAHVAITIPSKYGRWGSLISTAALIDSYELGFASDLKWLSNKDLSLSVASGVCVCLYVCVCPFRDSVLATWSAPP